MQAHDAFLRALGLCFLIAFLSFAAQSPGLYGEDGLEPVSAFLRRSAPNAKLHTAADMAAQFKELPTLLWFRGLVGLSVDETMDAIACLGAVCAAMCAAGAACVPLVGACWILQLSLVSVGQTFLSFQWDMLLLETGLAALLLAPWLPHRGGGKRAPRLGVWVLRALLFKLMFMSGVVKVQSRCPTWLHLTALDYHFATQCIPTPLAWFAHHAPPLWRRLGVAATLLLEIPIPFLFLTPSFVARAVAAVGTIAFMALIAATGNYTFFNLLTATLCIVALSDEEWTRLAQAWRPQRGQSSSRPEGASDGAVTAVSGPDSLEEHGPAAALVGAVATIERTPVGFAVSAAATALFISGAACTLLAPGPPGHVLVFALSPDQLTSWVATALPPLWWGILAVAAAAAALDMESAMGAHGPTALALPRAAVQVGGSAAKAALGIFLLLASTATYTSLTPAANGALPPLAIDTYHRLAPLRSVAPYGLFRRMTGVGDGEPHESRVARPEVVLEAQFEAGGPWWEVPFAYKPGNVSRAPPLVAPHQPRLDWQMWFAALGNYQGAPWIVHLAHKLLQGSPDVIALLAPETSRLRETPPLHVRARQYHYDFSPPTDWHASALGDRGDHGTQRPVEAGEWWRRRLVREDYLPPLSTGDASVATFLAYHGWSAKATVKGTTRRCPDVAQRSVDAAWAVDSWIVRARGGETLLRGAALAACCAARATEWARPWIGVASRVGALVLAVAAGWRWLR